MLATTKITMARTSVIPDGDRIISVKQWCEAAGFCLSTGKSILQRKQGPTLTRISERRVGIRVRDYQAWADARRETIKEAS